MDVPGCQYQQLPGLLPARLGSSPFTLFLKVGFDLITGGTTVAQQVNTLQSAVRQLTLNPQTVGAEAIIDAVVINTPIFVRNSMPSNGSLAGSLVINNAKLNNVPTAVGVVGGAVVIRGGTMTISSWGQGNVYTGISGTAIFTQGNIFAANKPSVLLDGSGRIFGKMHPQYASYAVNQFISVKDNGAKGDGNTDDTAALKAVFNQARPRNQLITLVRRLIFCELSVFWL
jgi:hypothetical protein